MDNMPLDASGSIVLSAPTSMKLARQRLLYHTSQKIDAYSVIYSPLTADSAFSSEIAEDLELSVLLHASTEMVATKKFDRARKLLSLCNQSASATVNPVQRVVNYLADGLHHRIERETRSMPSSGEDNEVHPTSVQECLMSLHPTIFACKPACPHRQVSHFTGIQAILDSTRTARRIHLIDFGIKSGAQWSILMQALADQDECSLELLKISAVGTCEKVIDHIGNRLSDFAAETLNIRFCFKTVVSDLRHLKKESFELESDEVVAIYSDTTLWTMLAWPDHLKSLIEVIESLNPCIVVLTEVEASTNVEHFVDCVHETSILYSTIFDIFETCVGRNHNSSVVAEGFYLGKIIRDIVTYHGEERAPRHAKLEVWRKLFARFGLGETELSHSSLFRANLLVQQSRYSGLCRIEMDGKCLIISWKGTPIISFSTWKFQKD